MTLDLDELERLTNEVTALDLSTAEAKQDDTWECPACRGEGYVDGTDYCNIDQQPLGVFIYGIGEKMVAADEWLHAVRNALPALIAAAREAERLRAELAEARGLLRRFRDYSSTEGRWNGGAHHNPIWVEVADLLEAAALSPTQTSRRAPIVATAAIR